MKISSFYAVLAWFFAILTGLLLAMFMQRIEVFDRPFSLDANADEIRTKFFVISPFIHIIAELVWLALAVYFWRKEDPGEDSGANIGRSLFCLIGAGVWLLVLLQLSFIKGYYGYYDCPLFWMDPLTYVFFAVISLGLVGFFVFSFREASS